MWMLFVLSSMAVALAALWFTLFAEVKGWAGLNYVSMYLAVWLPIVSLVTLAMLCSLAVRSGVRWRSVAVFSFAIAAIQLSFIVYTNAGRVATSFLPVVLLVLSGMAVVLKSHSWMERSAPLLAGIGLLALGGAFGARAIERRWTEESRAASAAEEDSKDASLGGLERAAWLLQREFYKADFNEAEFLRTHVYREPRSQGEYRWDEPKQRLVLIRPLFVEPWRREQILPYAGRALQTQALRPGPRADLNGGILECRPPLDCTVTWEFDVDRMHPSDRELLREVAAVEVGAWKEVSK
jgi:hypothetical protein